MRIAGSHDNNLPVASRDRPQPFNMTLQATGHALGMVILSFDGRWWGWNCARNSRVDYRQPSIGLTWLRAIEPNEGIFGCIILWTRLLQISNFASSYRLTVLPCTLEDSRTSQKQCGRWDGLLLRWVILINLAVERWCINSPKLSHKLRISWIRFRWLS